LSRETTVQNILSARQRGDLRMIAAMMIPASAEYEVPGADDPAIQDDILATLGRDAGRVSEALDHLARLAGAPLAELDPARREQIAKEFRTIDSLAATLIRVVLQCYYRDDRVLRSLGLELRPPFPKGYSLEQGDWSLLDPVKARPLKWRRAP
jgi:hypothetical protein